MGRGDCELRPLNFSDGDLRVIELIAVWTAMSQHAAFDLVAVGAE